MRLLSAWHAYFLAFSQKDNLALSVQNHRTDAHGWLVINKPQGISSAKAVALIRRQFGGVKTGHAGTLDPLASGVLPIAIGEATKTISYVMTAEKSYHFTVSWGAETQTDDTEGAITRTTNVIPSIESIQAILPQFIGHIEQIPPDYSAVKIQGKRAYALARRRDQHTQETAPPVPALAPRTIRIDKLELRSAEQNHACFAVECGKGAYVRALARDIGRALGSAAHVTALERRSVGKFHIENAISLDFLEKLGQSARASDHILSVMTVLDDIPAVALTEQEAQKLRFGQVIPLDEDRRAFLQQAFVSTGGEKSEMRAIAVFDNKVIALIQLVDGVIRPQRVLNL